MKKIMKLFVYVAAAAMTLASCQKNEIDNQVPQEYEYTFLIGNADTKAVIGNESVVWEDGDQMGVYTKVASGTISKNAYGDITPGSPATMKMYSDQALAIGDYVYAYYPYNSDNEDRNLMVTLSIPSVQDGKDDMPMVAIPYCVESAIGSGQQDAPAGKIKFANLGSVIEFHVYSTTEAYKTEIVKSVTFNAEQAIAGDFTFDLTEVDYSKEETLAISGYKATTVVSTLSTSTQVSADKNAATVVKMVVAPGSYTGNVVVTTDKAIYTYPISTAKAFKRSGVQPFGLNLRENVRQENTSSEPVEITATLTFDDKSKRTEYTTLKQVWTENGIILTNEKEYATTNVGNYCEPARFYKGSKIYVEAPGNIVNIVFNCNSSEYADALNNSITNSSKSGNDVTLTLDGNSTKSPEYQMSAKVFVNSVTVTYMSVEGGETPEQPTTPVLTVDPSEIAVEAVGGDKEITYTVTNPVDEGVLTARADVDWIDEFDYTVASKVTFSVEENTTAIARTATITLAYTGAESKTVTVKQAAASQGGGSEGGETTETWTLVTDASTLAVGDKIVIVASGDNNYALGPQANNNRTGKSVTKSGNTVEISDEIQVIELQTGSVPETFAFYTGEAGYLYAPSSTANQLKTKTELDANGSWSVSIASDGLATVTANGDKTRNLMRFNPNNDSPLFSCYASTQTLGTLVSIYKHVGANEGGGETPEPEQPKTLVSIAVSGQTTSYTVGDTFAFDGTVTATYSDRSTAEVEPTSVSTPNMTTEGEQAVTVTYTEGEETKTATYTITVTAAVEPEEPGEVIETTIADFLAAGVSETVWYQLTGKIKEIKNTTYGNFYLEDATGYVYVYGLTSEQVDSNDKSFSSLGLEEGDLVTLIGTRAYYANASEDQKDQVGGPAYYVSHLNFEVTPKVINVGAADTEAEFNVSCDAGYLPEYPNGVEELSVVSSSDVAYDTYKVKFLANETAEPKTYVISIKADVDGFNIEKTVTINQAGVPQEGGEEGDDVSGTVLYSEDFSSLTSWSTANKTTIQVNGVTYTSAGGNMYEQNGCLKFGKSSGASNVGVKLPTISSLSSATNVVLKFRAVSSDAAYTLKVSGTNCTVGTLSPSAITKHSSSINDGKNTQSALQQAFENSKVFTVDITDMTSSSVISIVANGSAKRWYIDDIEIVTN